MRPARAKSLGKAGCPEDRLTQLGFIHQQQRLHQLLAGAFDAARGTFQAVPFRFAERPVDIPLIMQRPPRFEAGLGQTIVHHYLMLQDHQGHDVAVG